jgi:hypothetical protein
VNQKVVNKGPDLDHPAVFADQVETVAQIWIIAVFRKASPPAIDLGISSECFEPFFEHANK